jgi:hypothetical protein
VRSLSAAVVLVLSLSAPAASAAPCNRPDLTDAMPPDAAIGVPTNASLHAKYRTSAEYLGEDIVLERLSTGETEIFSGSDPSWVDVEGVLSVTPSAPLEPGELYRLEWPRLRGVATATLGTALTVEFEAGATEDVELPLFDGIRDVEWDVERENDPCTDSQEERYVFDVEVPDAIDDGGRDSLTLLVFQTRGPDVDPGAPKPVLVSRLPAPGKTVRITETIGRGVGEICFAGVVRDLTGKVSGGGNVERCVETVEPPFFYGCALGGLGTRPSGAALFVLALVALGSRRRCARRS